MAGGRLAVGLVDAVPAGRYAKAALTHLGVWDGLSGQLAQTVSSVFGVLGLVAAARRRSESSIAPCADQRVMIGLFAEASHPPIIYPMAITKCAPSRRLPNGRPGALETARSIFERSGFTVLK
ncbi:MAG: hypothetical protein U1E97_10515 [Alphaproteobacteria bacterium]